jgi:hypothetical protein
MVDYKSVWLIQKNRELNIPLMKRTFEASLVINILFSRRTDLEAFKLIASLLTSSTLSQGHIELLK